MTASKDFWLVGWCENFSVLADMPFWVYQTIALLSVFILIVVPSCYLMNYFERKLSADFQARVGPNRAGPSGFLQPLADILKLIQKERNGQGWNSASPGGAWLMFYIASVFSALSTIPFGSHALLLDSEMSVFLPFWASLMIGFATLLLGLSQSSVPGWIGGLRVGFQTLAGAVPALVAILSAGVRAGGFRWSVLADCQGFAPWSWTGFSNPFQFVSFIVFIVGGLVLFGIPPMDGGASLSDLHGGVSSALFGRQLSTFRFGKFFGFFVWAIITVVLFLGAWKLPLSLGEALKEMRLPAALGVLELFVLLVKAYVLMLLVVWVARVNTRTRVDQVTDFSWKVLSPFALFALMGASLWASWRAI